MLRKFKRSFAGMEYGCVACIAAGKNGVPAVLIEGNKNEKVGAAVKFLFGPLSPLVTEEEMIDLSIKQFDGNNWLQRLLSSGNPIMCLKR